MTRVSKLTHDGSNVGPGDYDVDRAYKSNKPMPRGSVTLAVDRTKRLESFAQNREALLVGPGSYEIAYHTQKAPKQQTIPRAARSSVWNTVTKKKKKNRGSIRADFEDSGSESDEGEG